MVMAIVVGLALGQFYYIAEIASYLIAPFLMVMLFGVFLQVPFKNLRKGFMKLKVTLHRLVLSLYRYRRRQLSLFGRPFTLEFTTSAIAATTLSLSFCRSNG